MDQFLVSSGDHFAVSRDTRRRNLVTTNLQRRRNGKDAAIEDFGLYRPRADLPTLMLRRLAGAIAQYVELDLTLLHNSSNSCTRPKPSHADLLASPSTPAWLRSFATAAQLSKDGAHELAVLAKELHGVDLRLDLLGRAENLARAVRRAVARWESDAARGLLPPASPVITTAEEDEAIASLA